MTSRYDYMQSGASVDTDGLSFPDPLSADFTHTQLTSIPAQVEVTSGDISKFWLFMYRQYKTTDFDDIFLNLNNVFHVGLLTPGDELYLIDMKDMENFNTQKQPGA